MTSTVREGAPAVVGETHDYLEKLDRHLAWPMFLVTMTFLLCLGGTIQAVRAQIDVIEPHEPWQMGVTVVAWGLVILYPVYLVELVLFFVLGSPTWKQHLAFALVPPLRLGVRDHVTGERVWLPGLGWQRVNHALRRRVGKTFSMPMIVIALLVLPLLAIEFGWQQLVADSWLVAFGLRTGTTIIWLAFTIEFIVMVSIARKKIQYCTKHWLDLVIICLPLVSFLRALRLGQLMRLQYVARATRVYRLRGLSQKAFRAVLLWDVINRFLYRDPVKRRMRLLEKLEEKELELELLRAELHKLDLLIAEAKRERNTDALPATVERSEDRRPTPVESTAGS